MDDSARRSFYLDGFVRLPGFLGRTEVSTLREALEIAPERASGENPLSVDGMRFASNLFYASVPVQALLASDRVVELLVSLLGPDIWVRWDQAVWKHPGAPAFPLHQDNGYTGLPCEHLQMWIALTPASERNGGLAVLRGHHRRSYEHRWVGSHVVMDAPVTPELVSADPGDVILFSSLLPHATTPNRSEETRLAYVAEFLRCSEPDWSVPPPHLVIARGGASTVSFEDLSATWEPGASPGSPLRPDSDSRPRPSPRDRRSRAGDP